MVAMRPSLNGRISSGEPLWCSAWRPCDQRSYSGLLPEYPLGVPRGGHATKPKRQDQFRRTALVFRMAAMRPSLNGRISSGEPLWCSAWRPCDGPEWGGRISVAGAAGACRDRELARLGGELAVSGLYAGEPHAYCRALVFAWAGGPDAAGVGFDQL